MKDQASQLLSLTIARSWDEHIREFLVRKLGLPPSFDPRDHVSFIAANGRFMIHYDGSRDFCWEGQPVLHGEQVQDKRSTKYVITKLKN